MFKRLANVIRSTNDENEEDNNLITLLDRINIEIITLKGINEIKCNFKIFLIITTTMNNKPQEIIETKRIISEEKCYFDNNNWWLILESISIWKEGQLKIEFKTQLETNEIITLGSTTITPSMISEEVCDFEMTPHETSLKHKIKFFNIKIALRLDNKVYTLPRGGTSSHHPDFPKIGIARVTTWQGKNIASSYPVYLETTTNLMYSRRFRSPIVINPHNPIFDHISLFDLTSLQGDIFIIVREKHAVRSNRVVGQVSIPFSWIVDRLTINLNSPQSTSAYFSGWFELFPYCKPSRLNRGGQYRPYIQGIPQYAGYGLLKPEKSLGFLKIEIEFTLTKPLLYTFISHPFCHLPHLSNTDYEDENPLAGIYVAKNNFKRIMKVWRLPLIVKTVSDILHWRIHWSISAFVLYLHAYTFLLAPVWQFPLLVMFLSLFIGILAARKRTYDDVQLFVYEEALIAAQEQEETSKDTKSIAEKYKALKNGVKSMETSIDDMASLLEHCNNLLLMSDPFLSLIAFAFAIFLACLASFFLCFISPNTLVFLMGLALFSPDDAVLRSKVLAKEYGAQLSRLTKRCIRYAKKFELFNFKKRELLPGDYLHRLTNDQSLSTLKQHELSGFLYSKSWPEPLYQQTNVNEDKLLLVENIHWSSRWCEIWQVPGLLKVTLKNNLINSDILNTSNKNYELFVPFNLKDVEAKYLGKTIIEKRRNHTSISDVSESLSIGSSNDLEESPQSLSGRGTSFSVKKTLKTLYLFEIISFDSKNQTNRIYNGEDGQSITSTGWVFGCKSQKEAEDWIRVINHTSKLRSDIQDEIIDTNLPELHITTKVDEVTGKLVSTDMTQKIGIDEIKSGRDKKLSVIIKKFLRKWINMIPDDLELQHRYFCRLQYLVDGTDIRQLNNSQTSLLTDIIPTMNKFLPPTSNFDEGEQRTIINTSKRSRVDLLGKNENNYIACESDVIGAFLVTVINAKGLPVKELSVSAIPVTAGPFTLILPKIMVQISILPSSISSLVYKSGAQPRSPNPVFREDFLFRDINLNQALFEGAKIVLLILLRTPLSLGNETTTVISFTEISLKSFLNDIITQTSFNDNKTKTNQIFERNEWCHLFDPQTNLAINNNNETGIQIKIKYLGNID